MRHLLLAAVAMTGFLAFMTLNTSAAPLADVHVKPAGGMMTNVDYR